MSCQFGKYSQQNYEIGNQETRLGKQSRFYGVRIKLKKFSNVHSHSSHNKTVITRSTHNKTLTHTNHIYTKRFSNDHTHRKITTTPTATRSLQLKALYQPAPTSFLVTWRRRRGPCSSSHRRCGEVVRTWLTRDARTGDKQSVSAWRTCEYRLCRHVSGTSSSRCSDLHISPHQHCH